MRRDCIADARDLVARQIVHHDDVARPKDWRQELFGPRPEGLAIHRAVQRHGRVEAIAAQGRDEGGGAPMAVRGFGQKPFAYGTTPVTAHHVGGEAGLVDEDEALDIKGWLFPAPGLTRGLDVGPVLLGCVQGFF